MLSVTEVRLVFAHAISREECHDERASEQANFAEEYFVSHRFLGAVGSCFAICIGNGSYLRGDVHALHVLLPSVCTYMTPDIAVTFLDDEEDRARAEMQRVEAELMVVPRETSIERGSGVWPVLSRVLEESEIDLVVLGTHGQTGMQKVLLGSSAEEMFAGRRCR